MGLKERLGLDQKTIENLPSHHLDYYVAQAMGYQTPVGVTAENYHEEPIVLKEGTTIDNYTPSLCWKNAGPLVSAFDMDIGPKYGEDGYIAEIAIDSGTPQSYAVLGYGSTYQEAICRATLMYLVAL